jgi:hypothetical protein
MSERMGNYDSALQMFVQTPRPVDMSRLRFLRWLAEHGRLEHQVEGPSSGNLVASIDAVTSAPDVAKASFLKRGINGIPKQFLATGPAELRRTL